MLKFVLRRIVVLAMLLVVLPGCSYFQGAETNDDEELTDFDPEKKTDKSPADEDLAQRPTEGELELKLKVGDQFPLTKRIEQILTQTEGQGVLVNRSVLEMVLSLRVDDIRDGKRLLSVRYHRVRYGHNIAGRTVAYNSEANDRAPAEALAYAGLKDNGFSFWIGLDNRVVELVGFSDFLQRCLRDVPPQYRDTVMRQLENTSEEGLANFVDDGIGLLPYSNDPRHPAVAVKVGTDWELKPRRSEGPIPMNMSTRCTLKNLTDASAEIVLVGNIGGSNAPVFVKDGSRHMRVMVKGGHCSGTCTVDRRSGLPTHSEVQRSLEMSIGLQDGSEIMQRKEILTSITSFIDQSSPQGSVVGANREPGSNQISHTPNYGNDFGANRVTQAVGTSSNVDRRTESRSFESNSTR